MTTTIADIHHYLSIAVAGSVGRVDWTWNATGWDLPAGGELVATAAGGAITLHVAPVGRPDRTPLAPRYGFEMVDYTTPLDADTDLTIVALPARNDHGYRPSLPIDPADLVITIPSDPAWAAGDAAEVIMQTWDKLAARVWDALESAQ